MPRNVSQNVISKVQRINNSNKNAKNANSDKKQPKVNEYGDEIYQCEGGPHKFNNSIYRSKYDSNTCIPCYNPPKCSDLNAHCIDENTLYNTMGQTVN